MFLWELDIDQLAHGPGLMKKKTYLDFSMISVDKTLLKKIM